MDDQDLRPRWDVVIMNSHYNVDSILFATLSMFLHYDKLMIDDPTREHAADYVAVANSLHEQIKATMTERLNGKSYSPPVLRLDGE